MTTRVRVGPFLGLAVAGALALAGAASGEPPLRARLDALWEQYMLTGESVAIEVRNSQVDVAERRPIQSFEVGRGQPEHATLLSHGISVVGLGEGFWRNGGWILKGGLLGRASDGSSTLELYGKAVVRRYPYFPFPFHRAIPHETGYEFFLLHRRSGVPRATIVRQWVFPSDEVVVKRYSDGVTMEDVRGILRYDVTARTATVTITGLKRPFEERVKLSSERESAQR